MFQTTRWNNGLHRGVNRRQRGWTGKQSSSFASTQAQEEEGKRAGRGEGGRRSPAIVETLRLTVKFTQGLCVCV